MLQCHATYHAWHGTDKLGHLPIPRGLAHTQTLGEGHARLARPAFAKTCLSPVE